jgi:Ni/Co efflux regulator RcnB
MNSLSKIAGLAIALAFLGASPVSAKNPDSQGKSDGQKNSKGNSQKADSKNKDDHHEMRYAGIDKGKTRQYARQYDVGDYKPLPPGIRKNLARGKPIPPGIARTRLPDGYINQLPRYNGYEWRGYGGDLVLVDSRTQLIADVIMDAFR